ncbi:leucine-rich repeat, cysteine-containing subtype protein, partial [Tanacetum coccineum]
KGCTNLESLKVGLGDVSNEALECVGTHLKNLHDFCICLGKEDGIIDLPLDNEVRAMLMGCSKLERLVILVRHGGLTNVGLEHIGKHGANLRSLFLPFLGNSNAGLVKLSEGCPRLRKLKLWGCPFNKQVAASYVFNIPTLSWTFELISGYGLFVRFEYGSGCCTCLDLVPGLRYRFRFAGGF